MTPVIVYNPKTNKAKAYESVTAAAKVLKRDVSTVHRALTGDRNRQMVNNHFVTPVKISKKMAKQILEA